MSMISVSLVGNLVRDPENISFASGRVKTTMVVAINSVKSGDKSADADFYRVETWGKLAELANKHLRKGNQLAVSGRLVMEKWVDRQGRDRVTPVVSVSQLSLPPRLSLVRTGEAVGPMDELAGNSLEFDSLVREVPEDLPEDLNEDSDPDLEVEDEDSNEHKFDDNFYRLRKLPGSRKEERPASRDDYETDQADKSPENLMPPYGRGRSRRR